MSIKVTVPNNSSDSLIFGSANTTTAAQVVGIDSGSTNGQLAFYTTASGTSAEKMRIDSSGNVGVGVTPAVWSSGKALEIGQQGNAIWGYALADIYYTSNLTYNSGWKYASNSAVGGGVYEINGGNYYWYRAPSGTAGNAATITASMVLDSSGNLLVGRTNRLGSEKFVVGNTNNGWTAALVQDYSGANQTNLLLFHSYASGGNTATQISFLNSTGTTVGTITSTGSATAYNTTSDYRLKENIQPMQNALAKVAQLKPVTYTWKADGSDGQGFIAHELQAVVPDCVTGEKDAVDAEGNPVYQGIDTSFLVATLTAALQELKAELDTVKTELATLKGQA